MGDRDCEGLLLYVALPDALGEAEWHLLAVPDTVGQPLPLSELLRVSESDLVCVSEKLTPVGKGESVALGDSDTEPQPVTDSDGV